MTETNKSAARLLAEIRRLLGVAELPGELTPGQLATLMAGCRKTECKEKYATELQMVFDGIRSGGLVVRREERESKVSEKWVPDYRTYGGPFGEGPHLRQKTVITPGVRIDWISPAACVAWFCAIPETPPTHVCAWLGPAWQGDGPGPGPAKAKIGRPSDLAEKQRVALAIVRAFEEVMGPFPDGELPPTKENFLEACRRLEKAKTGKAIYFKDDKPSAGTVADWLRPAYSFKSGTPTEGNPYTKRLPQITEKFPASVFDAVS